MSKEHEHQAAGPPRLRDTGGDPLSHLVRAAGDEPPLSDITLARVHRRVLERRRRRPGGGRLRLLGLRFGVVAALLVLGASVGAAAVLSIRWWTSGSSRPQVDEASPPASPAPRSRRVAKRARPLPAEDLPQPSEGPKEEAPPAPVVALPERGAPPPAARPALARAHPPREGAPLVASSSPSDLAPPPAESRPPELTPVEREAGALAEALRGLRRGDRSAAVFQLRRYLQAHPSGAFREEAQVALVTALVEMGAHDEARAQLGLAAAHVGASPALSLLRAELTFPHDCHAAAPVFASVLSSASALSLQERALYGLVMTEWRCGEPRRARARSHEFLQRFPASQRAANVKEHLSHAGGDVPAETR